MAILGKAWRGDLHTGGGGNYFCGYTIAGLFRNAMRDSRSSFGASGFACWIPK